MKGDDVNMTSLRDVDAIDEANRCNTSFCTSTTMDLQSSCDDIMIIVIAYRVIAWLSLIDLQFTLNWMVSSTTSSSSASSSSSSSSGCCYLHSCYI